MAISVSITRWSPRPPVRSPLTNSMFRWSVSSAGGKATLNSVSIHQLERLLADRRHPLLGRGKLLELNSRLALAGNLRQQSFGRLADPRLTIEHLLKILDHHLTDLLLEFLNDALPLLFEIGPSRGEFLHGIGLLALGIARLAAAEASLGLRHRLGRGGRAIAGPNPDSPSDLTAWET